MSEEFEAVDYNTAVAGLIETGDTEDVQMLLGHKDRLRCGGIIRTGVKVPKSSCTDAEKKKFLELEAQGMGYEAIDAAIGGVSRSAKSKLVPRNANHFVVRANDFGRPSDAEYILNNFADPDSKVRSLPIWLSQDAIEKCVQNGFCAFNGGGQLVAASFYEGKELRVRYLPKDFKGGAVKKEDWKIAKLDPDNPVDPAGRKLDFGAIFRFNVPGLKGFDEVVCISRSWFGASYSIALLRRVRSILGRFSGLLNGQPFLQLSKVAEEIRHDGKTVTQYIPVIELSIDPMELARYAEPQAVVARARNAMSALAGPRPAPVAQDRESYSDNQDRESYSAEHAPVAEPVVPVVPPVAEAPFGNEDPALVRANEYLHGAAKQCRVTWPQFSAWACMEVTEGVALEDCSLEELRKVAEVVKAGLASPEREAFGAKVKEIALSFGVE